jgi:exopolyphosphatase/guanosine-5'-triphosphate,3'-diphosphate pyrophosphatase
MLAVEVPNLRLFSNGKLINSRSFKAGTVRLLNDMVCDVVWDEIEKWIKINTWI